MSNVTGLRRAQTYGARGLTKLPLAARRRLGPLAAPAGQYRIPFGLAGGLVLDARSLPLWSAQAHGVLRGTHEPQVAEAVRRTLPAGGTFVDVGAHIGYITLIAARTAGRVVAVEPVPENAAAIRRNAQLNGFGHVESIEAAAAATSGEQELITVADTIWTRLATVGEHPLETQRTRVRTVALDDLFDTPPDVVKIDVEGAELDVLHGMRRILAARRTTIICEMHGKNAAFADVMAGHGYRVTNLDGPMPIAAAGGNDHALAEPA